MTRQLQEFGKQFKGDLVVMDGPLVVPSDKREAVRLKVRKRIAELQKWVDRAERGKALPPPQPWHLVSWEGDQAWVRELPSGCQFSLQGSQLADFLAGVRVIFAADVFGLFQQAGVLASAETHRFDLMPMATLDGERQYGPGLRLEDFIQATLHTCYAAKASLEERLVYQAAFLSYGQLHGFVLAWQESREILVSHQPPQTLRPELYLTPLQVERPGDEQVYGYLAGVPTTLFYRDIYMCPSPPCASSLEMHAYRLAPPEFLKGPGRD